MLLKRIHLAALLSLIAADQNAIGADKIDIQAKRQNIISRQNERQQFGNGLPGSGTNIGSSGPETIVGAGASNGSRGLPVITPGNPNQISSGNYSNISSPIHRHAPAGNGNGSSGNSNGFFGPNGSTQHSNGAFGQHLNQSQHTLNGNTTPPGNRSGNGNGGGASGNGNGGFGGGGNGNSQATGPMGHVGHPGQGGHVGHAGGHRR